MEHGKRTEILTLLSRSVIFIKWTSLYYWYII